jgi:hypothetical protein
VHGAAKSDQERAIRGRRGLSEQGHWIATQETRNDDGEYFEAMY